MVRIPSSELVVLGRKQSIIRFMKEEGDPLGEANETKEEA